MTFQMPKAPLPPLSRSARATLAYIFLVSFAAAAQAPLDVRIALVIGNSAYAGTAALVNPANDAAAMSATLRTLGFTVVELKDGSRLQMRDAVASVRDSLRGKQGIGMLYYAGHGLQVDFRNYMVPVDAKLAAASDVSGQTIDVGNVIDAFKAAGNRMNIVVLDACRDNPFARQTTGKGLAPVDAPPGTFLAYATAPGNVAEDGDASASNGLYTGYLVQELQKPATRIEDVFKRVRLRVRQHSQGRQVPWESTSLEEDFFFNDGMKHTFGPDDLLRVAVAASSKQEAFKREAEQSKEVERQKAATQALANLQAAEAERIRDLELAVAQAREKARLTQMPAESAREQAFRTEKAEWEIARNSQDSKDLYSFLQKYPTGFTSELAQFRLDQLDRVVVKPQAGPDGVVALAQGVARYGLGDILVYSERDVYGKSMPERRLKVTALRGNQVIMNDGAEVWDEMGNLITDFSGTRNPAKGYFPADLSTGKQWRSAYSIVVRAGIVTSVYWDFRVQGLETITVPAGAFKAYRINGTSRSSAGDYQTETYWIDPATFLMIKDDWTRRTGGKITGAYQRELTSYVRR